MGKRKQDVIIITHSCQRIGVQSQIDPFKGNLLSEYQLHQISVASGEKKAMIIITHSCLRIRMQSQIDPFKTNLLPEYQQITPDKCSKWGKESKTCDH